MKKSTQYLLGLLFLTAFAFLSSSCKKEIDAPDEENEVEEFTYIEFIFTNENDPSDVRKGIWEDADGFGPGEPVILQHPTFAANQVYRLTFVMENRLLNPVYNLLEEIMDEEDEHQIFFEFTEGMFISPEGNGNIQNRDGVINYQDFDMNGLPVGLNTLWATGSPRQNAIFRAILAHQPDVKSETSTWDSGDIDWDISFNITIE